MCFLAFGKVGYTPVSLLRVFLRILEIGSRAIFVEGISRKIDRIARIRKIDRRRFADGSELCCVIIFPLSLRGRARRGMVCPFVGQTLYGTRQNHVNNYGYEPTRYCRKYQHEQSATKPAKKMRNVLTNFPKKRLLKSLCKKTLQKHTKKHA